MIKNSPVLKFLLGLCPTLAVTTSVVNGLGMGLAASFVLVFSNVIVSLIKPIIPAKIRIPIFLIVIVTFVTTIDLLMAAFVPELHRTLGVFIPLIVVNCIILGRVESFAYKHSVRNAFLDGLMMGISFTLTLMVIGGIRELLGNGTLLGMRMLTNYTPMLIMILPPGAFLVLGLLVGVANLDKK
ncbi:MAG: electron transport complex subunit E [Candidatus Margulisbacteria bacterium]|nr:electron transport complex subunit E [Candidatus Margulisiibacteriota bacterium]